MENKMIEKCPICNGKMYVSVLKCKECGIEIKGEFPISQGGASVLPLEQEDLAFVMLFLKHEGNMTKMAQELGKSFYDIRTQVREINRKMNNEKEENKMRIVESLEINEKEEKPSSIIIRKMNERNGTAFCKMLKGDEIEIRLTEKGVHPVSFPGFVCEWEIFDAIMEKAKELGGKMYRGDAGAQGGAKIGSRELPVDSIDGFISLRYYGREVGDTTTRRSTYYAAILAWAGLCENCRSDGNGGYILV